MVTGEEEKTAILYGLTWKHRVKWGEAPTSTNSNNHLIDKYQLILILLSSYSQLYFIFPHTLVVWVSGHPPFPTLEMYMIWLVNILMMENIHQPSFVHGISFSVCVTGVLRPLYIWVGRYGHALEREKQKCTITEENWVGKTHRCSSLLRSQDKEFIIMVWWECSITETHCGKDGAGLLDIHYVGGGWRNLH